MSASATSLYYEAGGDNDFQPELLQAWNADNANPSAPRPAAEASPMLAALRLLKDPLEIELLREASRLSAQAHVAALAEVAPGRHEYDLKAAMVALCLSRGAARMAYPPIVASGRNSVILHYERDDKALKDGEIIVNDTACEYSMYASDVTRSYPVSGRFSPEQSRSTRSCSRRRRPGLPRRSPARPFTKSTTRRCARVVDGLMKLGLLTGDRDEI